MRRLARSEEARLLRQVLRQLERLTAEVAHRNHGNGRQRHTRAIARVPAAAGLSPRELELMRLAAEGMHNREMALALHLSEHTIKNYLYRIYDKLGVSNRVELANYGRGDQHA